MKNIVEFDNLNKVVGFLEACKREFPLTSLAPIIDLVKPAFYSYRVSVNLSEESNYDSVSDLSLCMNGRARWGASSPLEYNCSLKFEWNTSSGHMVLIEGEINDFDTKEGKFALYIGTDESEVFYPCITSLAKACAACTLQECEYVG